MTKLKIKYCADIDPNRKISGTLSELESVSFIPMEAISETGRLTLQERKYADVRSGFTSFKDGDVILAKITPCYENGKGGVVRGLKNETGFGSTEFVVLRPNDMVLSDYLYFLIHSDEFRKMGEVEMTGSAGQKRISKKYVSNYKFDIPNLKQQNEIVLHIKNKVNKLEQIISNKQKLIDLLQEKRAALITHAVTKGFDPKVKMKNSEVEWMGNVPDAWSKIPLKFLFNYHSGGLWGDEMKKDNNDLLCVRVSDFDFTNFKTHMRNPTKRNIANLNRKYVLNGHSILLEKSGGGDQQPVGRVVRYIGYDKAICSNFIEKLQLSVRHSPEYITMILSAMYLSKATFKLIKKTTGIQNLDISAYLRSDIFIPNLEQQRLIVNFINTKSEMIVDILEKINHQIDLLTEFRSSLIYHAVTGKIKV